MPEPYSWTKLSKSANSHNLSARSGHTLTLQGSDLVCFGGSDGRRNERGMPVPNDDLHVITLAHDDYQWIPRGDKHQCESNWPPSRTDHSATVLDDHRLVVFGGVHSSTPFKVLNDVWILDSRSWVWSSCSKTPFKQAVQAPVRRLTQSDKGPKIATNQGKGKENFHDRILATVTSMIDETTFAGVTTYPDHPAPRSGHSCTSIGNGRVVLFGGCGGFGYARRHLNDVHVLNTSSGEWEEINATGNRPGARSGHGAAGVGSKIFVFGGRNSETQFNDLFVLDMDTKDWTDLDLSWSAPRWNMCMQFVHGLPSSKIFVFGGCVDEDGEGRKLGTFSGQMGVLDVSERMSWFEPVAEDPSEEIQAKMLSSIPKNFISNNNPFVPHAREHASMVLAGDRLVVFGGWSGKWNDDVWAIEVSSIIGPPYAVYRIDPPIGPVSGGTCCVLFGEGFGTPGSVSLRISARGMMSDVQGIVVDDTRIEFTTPKVTNSIGAESAEIRIAIGGKDWTSTFVPFKFFRDTDPSTCVCYGPGVMNDGQAEAESIFVIRARDDLGEDRKSGGDVWTVEFRSAAGAVLDMHATVVDKLDGTYEVKYLSPACSEVKVFVSLVREDQTRPIRGSPYAASFNAKAKAKANSITGPLVSGFIVKGLKELEDLVRRTDADLARPLMLSDASVDVSALISVIEKAKSFFEKEAAVELMRDQMQQLLLFMDKAGADKAGKHLTKVANSLDACRNACVGKQADLQSVVQQESAKYRAVINDFERDMKTFSAGLKNERFYVFKSGSLVATDAIDSAEDRVKTHQGELERLGFIAKSFSYPDFVKESGRLLDSVKEELANVRLFWRLVEHREAIVKQYVALSLDGVKTDSIEEELKTMQKKQKEIKADKKSDAFLGEAELLRRWLVFVPLLTELKDPSMRNRHWVAIAALIAGGSGDQSEWKQLRWLWEHDLVRFADSVSEITDQAKQEGKMETLLAKLDSVWSNTTFQLVAHRNMHLLKFSDDDFELLEEHQLQVQNMCASRFLATFEAEVLRWQKQLANINEISVLLSDVQKSWSFLENLFVYSEEVKKELPEDTDRFAAVDVEVKRVLADGCVTQVCLVVCNAESIAARLEKCLTQLSVCEKALNDFMERKRRAFPRFYFVSTVDLLDILSNGNTPSKVMVHLSKVFQCVQTYRLEDRTDNPRPLAVGMEACVGVEYVPFPTPLALNGKVEIYLESCVGAFRSALRHFAQESLYSCLASGDEGRGQWIQDSVSAQCVLLVNMITWVRRVEESFSQLKSDPLSLQKARDRSGTLLLDLIKLTTRPDLDKRTRQKVMCMITQDAHNRDIQEKLVQENVTSPDAFQWQAQLKAYWDDASGATIKIADATFDYGYEYLGNGPRLVITPLTDRIYVTCTQALHLGMGCAPAGPAGTGKTESTKDLANALGKACFVFNASPEMDYKTMGNIFKGLAASGTWGCFDEFNRLIPEVLSVCSVQFKAVSDAVKTKADRFILQGDELTIDHSVGVFITMNPGYLGRSNLPSSLSALFRPVTVMVADFYLIISNCLMSEGFLESDALARKFATLYGLCADLLSKAKQYDWGMRAIKSVLVVAGAFKRADPSLSEEAVLMRALRDTNVAKIDGDDLKIFMGLLGDLFPGVDVPRARNVSFEDILVETMHEMGYTNDDEGYLLLKITQLMELLTIRHCIFMMGPPGSFKSAVWRILAKAKEKIGEKTTWVDLNPKAVPTNELYGYVNMATREWRDGVLSKTMRALAQATDGQPKWIILDGDLDANWIESMNSVMDDNKLLTLPSNERIPLKPNMRMIFEIRDLNFATPATVTRAGVVNMTDFAGIQWRSFKHSWLKRVDLPDYVTEPVGKCFDKFCADVLTYVKRSCKVQVPTVDIGIVDALCSLLTAVFGEKVAKMGKDQIPAETIEALFLFCLVWAAGGCLAEVDGVDYRKQFSVWFKGEIRSISKFPQKGSVFDFFVNDAGRFEEWSTVVSPIDYSSDVPMSLVTVPTVETVSLAYIVKALLSVHHPVMLIGLSGCGKTQQCQGILRSLDANVFTHTAINMNYFTDSASLQAMMEAPLEKKAGRLFAPPGKLHLIYFIDDLNMQQLDAYNTQSAVSLLRQCQDYKHWYDRSKITLKDIGNTQLLCAMNPTAGSFVVDQRLQRHFWTGAVPFPDQSSLSTIYSTFVKGHFERLKFKPGVIETAGQVIKGALALHASVAKQFKRTAQQFHYEFNIRHLAGVFGGLLQVKPADVLDAETTVALWIHESERVYGDRLMTPQDVKKFRSILAEIAKKNFKLGTQKYFADLDGKAVAESIVFAPFAKGLDDASYDRVPTTERLAELCQETLKQYNDSNPGMDLVLFEDAVRHVARIARIISSGSHALLVGVGGSGRQSLSRLAGFACGAQVMTLVISSTYGMADLRNDLQAMYHKAGVKDERVLFLLTDSQITNERFLVYINDLLSCGEIADLYTVDEKDALRNAVRGACKAEGIADSPENLWSFFIARVKRNLHMSLCFSPVGDGLRSRARKFPALINCTTIDWFHPWPKEALKSVAVKFLTPVASLGDMSSQVRKAMTEFIPFSFECVSRISERFMRDERRFAYTTPKSFLELIKLYTTMLDKKLAQLEDKRERLTNGLSKLRSTQLQVAELEAALKETAVVVEEKARSADAFATQVSREKEIVNAEVEKAAIEKRNCEEIATTVEAQQKSCEQDLAVAIPLVQKAEAALDVLNKKDFQELKSFAKPPPGVDKVCEACLYLLAGIDPNIEVDKKGKVKEASWKGSQKMMSNPERFLESLKSFKGLIDKGTVTSVNIEAARPVTTGEDFTVESMTKKSKAAAGLCEWVLNIVMYFDVVASVEPKRKALREATETLSAANTKLAAVQALVAELQARLDKLIADLDAALADKNGALAEADRCRSKLEMAQRLIGALGANGGIWEAAIQAIGKELEVIPGDVVVASSFVSYLAVFSREYRESCLKEFVDFLKSRGVPLSPSLDPLTVLTDEAELAKWQTHGLPSDRVSSENGAVISTSQRWCLLIDPQLQGIQWIRNRESHRLVTTRMGHPKMVSVFEDAIENGKCVLIENMGETIDAVLAPVIGRNIIRRGRSKLIRLGDKELVYNDNFMLIMHTMLSNPHFPPEVHAECTVINFSVTEQGLEEQLLFQVVKLERADLAKQKADLVLAQNQFKVKLAELEALLLNKLANAEGDILEDTELILSLEDAKLTSEEVKAKVVVAKQTEAKINETSESYRPCASRGALLFFFLKDLQKIHSFYRYSLDSFVAVVTRAVLSASGRRAASSRKGSVSGLSSIGSPVGSSVGSVRRISDDGDDANSVVDDEDEAASSVNDVSVRDLSMRVDLIVRTITRFVFAFTARGLLDQHKLTAATLLCLRILVRAGTVSASEADVFIKGSAHPGPMPETLKSWLPESAYSQLKLVELNVVALKSITAALETESLAWKRWLAEEKAEQADLPRQMRDLGPFHKLMLIRILRPDRLSAALSAFVSSKLGPEFVEKTPFDMEKVYSESSSETPLFFVLFPGVDPTPLVEGLARRLGIDENKFVNISMGQGQEQVALNALVAAAKEGGWVMLQNIHLMQSWLKQLERTLEQIESTAHAEFRCILSSEPPPFALAEIVPESILQKSIKIADEAPQDIKANLRRAWGKFSQSTIELAAKPKEFKACLFGLCFFHALVVGRKRFGAQGWSRVYPFNDGDLTICASVLANYLAKYDNVPWPDLRYVFGEIMYGGHVTDQWDRRVTNTYLSVLVVPELLNNMQLAPNFKSPDAGKLDYANYAKFIEDRLPAEAPQMFGLHPNAEFKFATSQAEQLMVAVQSVTGGGRAAGTDSGIQNLIATYLGQLPKLFDLQTMRSRITDWNPYIIVALQECERMNALLFEIKRSLVELEMGLSGTLNITDQMEELVAALTLNKVFSSWEKLAYFSLKPLSSWMADLVLRAAQLQEWTTNLQAPKSVWISGLFNPMSYLTAVMQVTARQRKLPLDSMTIRCVFTNIKDPKLEVPNGHPPNGGVYIHGLFLEGASWEDGKGDEEGYLADSKLKVLHPAMPVVNVFAVPNTDMDWESMYHCPVYITSMRGPTYLFTANVRMEPDDKESRWVLGGTTLLLTDD